MQRIKIKYDLFNLSAEILSGIILVLTLVLFISSYGSLPDIIPVHFNFKGEPDSFGTKTILWLLPVISIFFYAGFTALARFPHKLNYVVKITEENAIRQYALAVKFIFVIKVLLLTVFLNLLYESIAVAMNEKNALTTEVFIALFIMIFVSLAVYIYKSVKEK